MYYYMGAAAHSQQVAAARRWNNIYNPATDTEWIFNLKLLFFLLSVWMFE